MGCKFGNLCSCDVLVNAPESTGCNGTYTSDWGDIEINSLCREYCGCPSVDDSVDGGGNNDCDDKIESHPAFMFGGLCDCETLVSAPESTGCGGVYKSDMGDIAIDERCPVREGEARVRNPRSSRPDGRNGPRGSRSQK